MTYFLTGLTLLIVLQRIQALKCDRRNELVVSELTQSNNGKYVLKIVDKPEMYVPNKKYEVRITTDDNYNESKFKKFLLRLEPSPRSDDPPDVTHNTGKLELDGDGLSQFSYTCPNTVVEANTQPKKLVTLSWVAPSPNSGCVTLRATVIESREKWYADGETSPNGYLTKTLCEDSEENEDELPEKLDKCCACSDAKYEMAFQGNWIRNNHPRRFPKDPFTTRFSDIIGASHKNGQEFWLDDSVPSQGLKDLAFNGSTLTLESELMDNIENLHTIIKARGLTYPDITSSSYAVFRVDPENHLVTMVTKIIPSPDWVVGVQGMELCIPKPDCNWKKSRTINLYPRDVGINDGVDYTENLPNNEESPLIKQITTTTDTNSPFYDQNGEPIKPIAKLHFKLQKIYHRECENKSEEENEEKEEDTSEERQVARRKSGGDSRCRTIGWGDWSGCSVECGKGHMTRNVKFEHPPSSDDCKHITREETLECEASCTQGEEVMHICSEIVWTEWSPCSVSCGNGTKTRYRHPSSPQEEQDKICMYEEKVLCTEQC